MEKFGHFWLKIFFKNFGINVRGDEGEKFSIFPRMGVENFFPLVSTYVFPKIFEKNAVHTPAPHNYFTGEKD
jgi:hypothetical protein